MKNKFTKSWEKLLPIKNSRNIEESNVILENNNNWKKNWKPKLNDAYSWALQKGAQISCLIK